MKIEITTKNGKLEKDVEFFSVNEHIRTLMLHNSNGTIECYNMDFVEKFTIPTQALKGTS